MVSWPPCSPLIGQYAANWSPSYSIMQENILHHGCGYTLWYLEPTVRSALELETNLQEVLQLWKGLLIAVSAN